MQTFLPLPNFVESASCLDKKRLGKQRVECLQLLNTLLGHSTGWANHPATRMWRGYELALGLYAVDVCNAWVARGYSDSVRGKVLGLLPKLSKVFEESQVRLPPWYGMDAFHEAHRSNLLRKDPDWYGRFGWTEPDDLPYVWPV